MIALLDCAEAAFYITSIIKEVSSCLELKINCITDNKNIIQALYFLLKVGNKRLQVDMAVIKGILDRKEIKRVTWVAMSQQIIDCFTKIEVSIE